MQSIALGEIGIAPSEFWDMTLRDILNAHKGHDNKETRNYRLGWERTRWLAAVIARSFGSKSQPRDLIKFPWEADVDYSEDIAKVIEMREKVKKHGK